MTKDKKIEKLVKVKDAGKKLGLDAWIEATTLRVTQHSEKINELVDFSNNLKK